MAISHDIPEPSIIEFSLKITYVVFHSNLPGDNELTLLQFESLNAASTGFNTDRCKFH